MFYESREQHLKGIRTVKTAVSLCIDGTDERILLGAGVRELVTVNGPVGIERRPLGNGPAVLSPGVRRRSQSR